MKTVANYFGVIGERQTYINMLYLLISFPLGILYFIFFTAGLSLGVGLMIIYIGVPILLLVCFLFQDIARFELKLANWVLKESPVVKRERGTQAKGVLGMLKERMDDTHTWKSGLYLLLKFPIGIFSFVALVSMLSTSLGLIGASIIYSLNRIGILPESMRGLNVQFFEIDGYGNLMIDSYLGAVVLGVVGGATLITSIHIYNFIANKLALFTKSLLKE